MTLTLTLTQDEWTELCMCFEDRKESLQTLLEKRPDEASYWNESFDTVQRLEHIFETAKQQS